MTQEEMLKEIAKKEFKDLSEVYSTSDNKKGLIINEILYNSINDGIPDDKNKLCIFYDGDYYIDSYNNLSSTDQKQLLKWCYLPLIEE